MTAKYELIAALPSDGLAVFNNDDANCRQLADSTTHVSVARFGIDTGSTSLDVWADAVVQSPSGLQFTVHTADGQSREFATQLFGRHNVSNILAGVCVARHIGMSLEACAAAVGTLRPTPHRLSVTRTDAGATIIDDSFNSNPVGAHEALAVLRGFTTGKRILVTPGMIELGSVEVEENRKLGQAAASSCDYAILVGPARTQPILDGLVAESFPMDRIRTVRDLGQATLALEEILQPGDTVLFENDLPDLYSEV
jgi:UDP-N-acetylmuramoyl-tripeptide--D-alanyl-D-alanine ligase